MSTQSMSQLEALVRRNAEACAQAKRQRCNCQCKGTLHKKPHTEEWIQQTADRLYAEAAGEESDESA